MSVAHIQNIRSTSIGNILDFTITKGGVTAKIHRLQRNIRHLSNL